MKTKERYIVHVTVYNNAKRKEKLKPILRRDKKRKVTTRTYRNEDVTITSKYVVLDNDLDIQKFTTREFKKLKGQKKKSNVTVNLQKFVGSYKFTKKGQVLVKGVVSPAVRSHAMSSKSGITGKVNAVTNHFFELDSLSETSNTSIKKRETKKDRKQKVMKTIERKNETKKQKVIREETEYLTKLNKRKKENKKMKVKADDKRLKNIFSGHSSTFKKKVKNGKITRLRKTVKKQRNGNIRKRTRSKR
jgi:hypothetical protein